MYDGEVSYIGEWFIGYNYFTMVLGNLQMFNFTICYFFFLEMLFIVTFKEYTVFTTLVIFTNNFSILWFLVVGYLLIGL